MAYNFKKNANGTFGVINNKLNNLNPLQLSVQPKQLAPKLSVATPTKINNSLPVQFTAPKTNTLQVKSNTPTKTLNLQDNRPFPMRVPGSSPVSTTALPKPVSPTTNQVLSKALSDGFGWIPKTAEGIGNSVLSTAKLVPDVALLGTSKLIGDDKSYKEASKLFNNNLKNSIPGGAVSLLQKAGNEIAGISYAASKIPEAIQLSNQIKSAQKSGDKVKEQFYRDQYKKFNEASGQEVFDYYNNISPTVTGDVGSYNTPDSIEKGDSITPAIKGVAEIAPWMLGGSSSRVTNALVQGAIGGTTNAAMQLANGQPFDFSQLGQAVAAPAAFGALMPSKGNKSTIVKQADEAHINMANALDNATDSATKRGIINDMIATQKAKALANSPELATTKYNVNKVNSNEAYTLSDYAEMLNPKSKFLKDTTNPSIIDSINQLNQQARNAANTAGIDITSGSKMDIQNRIIDFMEQYDNAQNPSINQTNVRTFTQKPDQRGSLNVGQIADDLTGKNKTKITVDPTGKLGKETPTVLNVDELNTIQSDLHKKASDSFKTAEKNLDGTLTETGKAHVQKAVDDWGVALDKWKSAVDTDKKTTHAPQVTKTDPVAKYGWESKDTPKGTELANRNGKVVAIITTNNKGRHIATHPDGTKIASAGGSKDAFAQQVATKYYYASEVKPTPIPTPVVETPPTERFYLSDIQRLQKKYGALDTDPDRSLAKLADKHFNELDPQTQRYLEFEARGTDFESRTTPEYKGFANADENSSGTSSVHGSQIYQLRQAVDDIESTPAPQVTKTPKAKSATHQEILTNLDKSKPTDTLTTAELRQIGLTDAEFNRSREIAKKAVDDIYKANSRVEAEIIHDAAQAKLGETVGDVGYLRKGVADAEVLRKQELVDSGIEPSLVNPTGKSTPQVTKTKVELGKETPKTNAYGKKIEMTEKNGYKSTNTADGGVIYEKVNRTGSNAKGTQLTNYYYDAQGNKITQAQAEAMVSGKLSSTHAPQVTKTEVPAITPLSQPVDNIPQIAKQVTSSQKTNAPKTVKDTTTPQKAKQQVNQPKSNKKGQSFETIVAENRLLPQGELPIVTPSKAKQIFKKTGRINPFETTLKSKNGTFKLPENSSLLDTEKVRAEVTANLKNKADNLERTVYGDATSDITGGAKTANGYVKGVRSLKEGYNNAIGEGMSSEVGLVRNVSRGIRTLFGSAGDTAERISKKGSMRGGIDESISLANDFKKLGDTMLPDKVSQERVWAVLDPELSGKKISEVDLSPQETKALQTVRQASDLINDTNFSMGKISHETWLKGKDGKYLTRAYEEFDVPTELKDSQAFKAGKGKIETGGYMRRKDVDTWKQENAIKDPFYLASKRIQSTMRNKSITDYSNWINKNADMVSDVPKKGYTQLSDSPMWGELSGKSVRHDVLTDIKGFYSDSKALQGAYDALNAYDRFKPRQILKSTKTVLNPATRLGNQISNRVFAAMNGVNIAKFEWNMHKFAPQELAKNGKYARLLRKEGVLGTDMTKYELAKTLVKDGVEQSKISQVFDKIKSSYGAADDKAKLSAFKYWLDRGKTVDEAVLKVRNGFQDYSKVGLLYDIGAKTPLVGKSFIRFQSELARIIKNSATENPLSLATVVGSIALIGNLSSQASGETPEDKATREGRFGTPVIPFTQIPLVFQTPIGEVNVARMFGMYETAGADTKNKNLIQRASKYLPFDAPTSKDDLTKMLGNDVLTGGIMNQITDTDFRGKSISDPESNKYQESTLTNVEKLANRAGSFYRNYQIPFVNDVENLGRSVLGEKDQYGRVKTPLQAGSKLTGFKIEQFGPEEAKAQREKDAVYADYDKKDLQSQINSVLKQQAEGKIDAKTSKARIDNLNKSKGTETTTQNSKIFANPNGGFSYLDNNGSLQTAKTEALADLEIKKMDFKSSDKSTEIIGDKVLRKSADGNVSVMSKDSYDYQLGESKLDKLKTSRDISGWMTQANKQLEILDKQMSDKNIDELDKMELEKKADTLIAEMQKYVDYGGFSKSKTASSKSSGTSATSIAKILAANKNISDTTASTMKKLNALLASSAPTKPTIRRATLKAITVRGAKS